MRIIRAVATVVSCTAFFAACSLQTADFSAYSGKNLIPEAQLDRWIPDQDLTSAPGNLYMGFDRIDNAATATYASVTGFADSAALYSGLPASANMANGALPPVYRLEIKNLFVDGDLEGSPLGTAATGLTGNPTLPASGTETIPINGFPLGGSYIDLNPGRFLGYQSTTPFLRFWGIIDASDGTHYLGLNSGRVLTVTQSTYDTLSINLSTNMTYFPATGASYNLGFRVFIKSPLDYYLSVGTATTDNSFFHVNSNQQGAFTFPTDMTAGSTSTFNTFNGVNTLYFNPLNTFQSNITSANYDDFKIVQTDRTYAVRYEVPFATGAGLNLVQGGKYTISAYIRTDPTATWGDANKLPNRFKALKTSLAISDAVGTSTQYWPSTAVAVDTATGWTKISASFTGLLSNSSTYNTATPGQKLLQLTITVTDTTNDSTQFPGSILITSPQLTFTP